MSLGGKGGGSGGGSHIGIPVFFSFHCHIVLCSPQKAFVDVCTFFSVLKHTFFLYAQSSFFNSAFFVYICVCPQFDENHTSIHVFQSDFQIPTKKIMAKPRSINLMSQRTNVVEEIRILNTQIYEVKREEDPGLYTFFLCLLLIYFSSIKIKLHRSNADMLKTTYDYVFRQHTEEERL